MAATPPGRAARVAAALLLALPLSLGVRRLWTAAEEAPRVRLEAQRTALRDSLKALEVAWGGELETTWKPAAQLDPPDSLSATFIRVAIDRAGRPKPVGVPAELLRWTNPAEAAPPPRVGGWLATRVTTTAGRRSLLARALPAGMVERLAAVSDALGHLNDAALRRREPLGYVGPWLVTALLLLLPALLVGRRKS